MPKLQSLRNRLRGIPGGALVVAFSALLTAQACTTPAPQPVSVTTTPQRTTTTTTTTTQAAPAEPATPPSPAPSAAPQPASATPEQASNLSADQLDSLVAPIALYPDPLLAQCLVASTYPLDIVAAQQWLAKNSTLKGEALVQAAEKQPWDPSVQALVSLPDALKVMGENIQWTTQLGDAFLGQESEVMDAVQRLRAKAKDGGKLASSEQQKVETKVVEEKTVIEIQPASTEVVYVPTYSPTVIWGPMYYPYPPLYYPPYYGGAWLGFGVGIAIGIGISGGWGWGCGWGGNNTSPSTTTTTTSTTTTGRTTSTGAATATGSTTPSSAAAPRTRTGRRPASTAAARAATRRRPGSRRRGRDRDRAVRVRAAAAAPGRAASTGAALRPARAAITAAEARTWAAAISPRAAGARATGARALSEDRRTAEAVRARRAPAAPRAWAGCGAAAAEGGGASRAERR